MSGASSPWMYKDQRDLEQVPGNGGGAMVPETNDFTAYRSSLEAKTTVTTGF